MTDYKRPDPDMLLKAAQFEVGGRGRGRLKIFFGACAGVGKTYAMLSAGRQKAQEDVKVLAGIVETHGRLETEKLIEHIPHLPLREVEHRGVTLKEFDLDAALKARPDLILVDEFAHTNAPGSRHPKRWMDVQELLEAGIDVYTTLNVQHIESLNDMVAGITGVRMKETVPDGVFDAADDITLIDIPSGELLQRLHEGKVYTTDLGKKRAAENFFRENNLVALREMALRRTAERVDTHLHSDRHPQSKTQQCRVAEKITVCIGTDRLTPDLLRAAKRLAGGLKAPWGALYVENARHFRLKSQDSLQVEKNFHLARQMGGEAETLYGDRAAAAIMDYARAHGITKIVIGKRHKARVREWLEGSLANDVIRQSGNIDVVVVTDEGQNTAPLPPMPKEQGTISWPDYLFAISATAIATVISLPFKESLRPENFVMLYLVGIILTAARYGWKPSLLASVLSFLSYNFFFTVPYYTFAINDINDLLTVLLLLVTGIIGGMQTSRLRAQGQYFRTKERNTAALYAMSTKLTATRGRENITAVIREHLEHAFDAVATVWLPDPADPGTIILASHPGIKEDVKEEQVAWWAYEREEPAGAGTSTLPGARGYYVPIEGTADVVGVFGIIPNQPGRVLTAEERGMLETFGSLAASALERADIADVAEKRKVETETERLRNTLLSSVSHDLRTPLASIKGSISSLMVDKGNISEDTRDGLLQSAYDETSRLERIVSNLLDITLLESGTITLKKDYYFVPELIGSALKHLQPLLEGRKVECKLASHIPAIQVDGVLMEQVLVNLLENAAKYTPSGTPISLHAESTGEQVSIAVEDRGLGIPRGEEEKIFDKFYTTKRKERRKGSGLGLAICRGIVHAHGGTIRVENRQGGGASFVMLLPVGKAPKMENT